MTIQLKTKKTVEENSILEIPCFFKRKDGCKVIGVFDESEVIAVFLGGCFVNINVSNVDSSKTEISDAVSSWDIIDEQEFRVEHAKAIRLVSLPQREITTTDLNERYQHAV